MSGQQALGIAFAFLTLGASGPSSALAGTGAVEACAARDLIVFGLIEKHGEDQTLPAEVVADASMELLSARTACRDGRETEAIATYTDPEAKLGAAAGGR